MNADSSILPSGFDPAATLYGFTVRQMQHDFSYNASVGPANRKLVRPASDDPKRAAFVEAVVAKLKGKA